MAEPEAPDRPVKRSLTLSGHRTSVSLEAAFWDAFRELAAGRGVSVNALAAEIDAARMPPASLASAIRVFVLREIRAGSPRRGPDPRA
ncbi:ribbon-helix-helix domain-containing protein [Paralimibaculum aggregatum]|uniref:Ribbon-helix-helix domain-containing protein n=1 Tax=Paralimibaculum aggregatum TaxID=3036245 RepID=A0ABQ6LKD1_9RHOB|nr:ribbon-helix-helix domain-containing protein [Limibaculum sp. NKW23]GMG82871.1 ribbon-helix-helix domain-containing protein [Limibaculum sp. NKW23]